MGLLLPAGWVCSYVKRAERPLVFFNLEVLIESRASDSTSEAILYDDGGGGQLKIFLGYAKTYCDKTQWISLL